MSRALRILLIAEEAAGMQTLRMLAGSPHHIVAVVTGGIGGLPDGATVAAAASQSGYRLWPARCVKENGFAETIRREEVDLLLNVHALYVLPADVVAAPRIGCFNLHPGPLPRYAGLNAPSWAIYNGERTHAVTLHWMDGGIDTGPIAYQTELVIEEDDTGLTLSAKCVRAGLPQIRELLEAAVGGTIPLQPQLSVYRLYYGREAPNQGRLIWSESAARVVNFVRACDYLPFTSPWGYPRACLRGRYVSVLKAWRTGEPSDTRAGTVGRQVGGDVLVAAGDEWVRVGRVRVGDSTFNAAEVLRPGDRFVVHPSSEERSRAIA
jgi:methionyl-tRNA formyltransferase